MIKTCIECGTTFETEGSSHPQRKYCSVKCREERARRTKLDRLRKIPIPADGMRTCPECGKRFPFSGIRQYCSNECTYSAEKKFAVQRNRKKRLAVLEARKVTCSCCGKEFTPYRLRDGNHKMYCSKECRYKAFKVQKRSSYVRKPPPEPRACSECGKVFTPIYNKPQAETCSPYCSQQRQIRLRKEANASKERAMGRRSAEAKRARRLNRYSGNWGVAMERDKHTCQVCGCNLETNIRPTVHHWDGQGESRQAIRENANNVLENLISVCSVCHAKMHKISLAKKDGQYYVYGSIFKDLGISGPLPILTE